jgi:hypothetical protein
MRRDSWMIWLMRRDAAEESVADIAEMAVCIWCEWGSSDCIRAARTTQYFGQLECPFFRSRFKATMLLYTNNDPTNANTSSWKMCLTWSIMCRECVCHPTSNSKSIPLTGPGVVFGCEMLRIPHCLDNRLTDGGKVVSLTHRPRSTPKKHYFSASGTHYC